MTHNFELMKHNVSNYNLNNIEFLTFKNNEFRMCSTHTFWLKLNIVLQRKIKETKGKKHIYIMPQYFDKVVISKRKC